MPISKAAPRDHKEDTWRPEELEKSLRGVDKGGGSNPPPRSRDHRGVAKEQHPADNGSTVAATSDGKNERLKSRRSEDPAAADSERPRQQRGSRAPPPDADGRVRPAAADADDERRRSDGRRRADADNDDERPRRHRREGDDAAAAAAVDRDGDDRPRRRGSDGERHERRSEPEARGGGEGNGDDDERRRRRREERRRRDEDRGGGGNNDEDDDRRHRRRRTEDDGAGGGNNDDDNDRRHRRHRTEDDGGGGAGENRRRRGDEEGAGGGERRSSKRGGDAGDDEDEERRRRHEERRRRRRDGADADSGADGGRRADEEDEDAERRRRRRREERGVDDGVERDPERRHKRAEGDARYDDGEALTGNRDRRRRGQEVTETGLAGGERDKENGGGHRRRRDERDPDRDVDAADERSHPRRREGGVEEERGGGRRRKDAGGKEEKERDEDKERRQEKEHRRRPRDGGAAADSEATAAGGSVRRDKTAERPSVTSGNRSSSDGRAANDAGPEREIFRSRNSRQQADAADSVEDEAIESRASRKDNDDVPVLKLGAANSTQDAYDEDFEDYDEDFEEADDDDNHKGSTKLGNLTNREVDDLFEAMNRENDRLLAESRNSSSRDSQKRDYSRAAEKERGTGGRPSASSSSGGGGGRPRGVINFVSAKQREMSMQVSSRARKRGKELLQIIELDSVYLDLFEMAPVKEYELYMRSFGRTNSRQVYVQTNADSIERDIQTDEIESDTKWTQHPADDARLCCGGVGNRSGTSSSKTLAVEQTEDVVSLLTFLQRSSQVVEALLAEDERHSAVQRAPDKRSAPAAGAASRYSFSDGFVSLGVDAVPTLRGREVTTCCFSPSQPSMLLTGHGMPRQGEGDAATFPLSACGLVCLWNANSPQQPIRLLAAAEQPTCCCFGPLKTSLVFAGMLDGSVVAWDLRDSSPYVGGGKGSGGGGDGPAQPPVVYPAYCTAAVLRRGEGHSSAVAALLPVLADGRAARARGGGQETIGGGGAGLSFQLASLEQSGAVSMWVVADVGRDLSSSSAAGVDGGNSAAAAGVGGLSSDLGLAPGARVKLLKSSGIRLTSGDATAASAAPTEARKAGKQGDSRSTTAQQLQQQRPDATGGGEALRATTMQLDPANSSRLFVGTDVGFVLHAMRYGAEGRRPSSAQRWRSYTATWRPASPADAASGGCTAAVTAMDVSPFLPLAGGASAIAASTFVSASASLLLVGCADGSVRLHTPLQSTPVVTLPPPPGAQGVGGSGVRCAQWSRTRPTAALVLDESSVMHTWDLVQSDATPVKSDALADGTRRAVAFALSEVESASSKPRMALCFSNGAVELHTLASHSGAASKPGDIAEVEQLLKYIDSL